jgi:hypothetical protein
MVSLEPLILMTTALLQPQQNKIGYVWFPGLGPSQASRIQLGLVWLPVWPGSQASTSPICTVWVAS